MACSAAAWTGTAQFQRPALRQYRLISYDLRGHGLSDKPAGAEPYHDGRRWADDLDAVIRGAHARRPVLVGLVAGRRGDRSTTWPPMATAISAAPCTVDGVVELKPEQLVSHPEDYRDMTSPELRTHLDGERRFLALCFHRPPDAALFERLLANAAMASWDMQRAVPGMTVAAAEGLSRARVPLLFIQGGRDALVDTPATLARARALNPRIASKLYEESGHAPFIEEPERFNRDLADFVGSLSAAQP